jgi:pimeloyl-ACP methyl ester carboxylesterase
MVDMLRIERDEEAMTDTAAEATKPTTAPGSTPTPRTQRFIDGLAELMAHSARTPILRRPDEYGLEYEDVFFPAMDGVTLEGWLIPADSDRLLICNHPMPCNRYGYPGHLEPWTDFGGFEVNFLPEYKILHDAGYNILTYDLRNHGRSGMGSGGIIGHGLLEYRDVIGSLHYAKSRIDTKDMKTALYSRCLGANSTVVAMNKYPEEFRHILAMIALQPAAPRGFVEAGLARAGIADGRESFDKALHRRSGYRLDDFRPIEDTRAVTVPTLVAQVHDDFTMPPSYVQAIYDNISAQDKKLFWIEGTDLRFQGYNYFGEHPELVLEWLDTHMS